ncbi:hypothetical protein OUZ56_026903 [Daphnia magna]|uniref:Uncharacterized protein n=1 Tax=Daphnia magna TaxID=35525 RepID=A0ABQ9ZP73_9CRUS|nr:hypothetical protein OUZ56_026903 [Daphnia magna]
MRDLYHDNFIVIKEDLGRLPDRKRRFRYIKVKGHNQIRSHSYVETVLSLQSNGYEFESRSSISDCPNISSGCWGHSGTGVSII